jgi:hypothetical protein
MQSVCREALTELFETITRGFARANTLILPLWIGDSRRKKNSLRCVVAATDASRPNRISENLTAALPRSMETLPPVWAA